ncbi:penicillin-binding transpeptidase domain-containing protein [Streptomyces sp. NBC_01808]|uniref:peptidoglycan D,D-transpeptidase FtsI family protein n=1 Tax=Streptomyces sp. NBC_01808 TaxID=2975947 RepID=UPI002DDAD1C4|nr:penicillin-binding transpeptidase domain-containing protein [Streptomyces sp. NBC_01808]WSA39078.1 penicillin-binding transpeptidase domain-containing protein [Streptomyces sp. NBC_01808]
MNKPLRRVAVFCGLLVIALLVRVNWIQFVEADELRNHEDNRRVAIERYAHPRGNIIVGDKAITGSAETSGSDFKYKRTYKDGPLWAPVTGYASQAFGANQLEALNDGILTGNDDRLFFNRTIDMITGKDKKGGNVVTTLDANVQKAAFEGLGDRKGAVAAIDPETGAILGLASSPSYDPSSFAGNSNKDSDNWVALNKDKDKPMLNRALRETYPPGSTFKVVTAAAALESGKYDMDESTGAPETYKLPLSTNTLGNEVKGVCEDATLREALQWSCNSVYAMISDKVGNEGMIEMSEKFGFGNAELDTPVRAAESIYPEMDRPQNAMGGIGQASNRATPLQMAMVASAVANDGELMKPYMVEKLVAPNLNDIEVTQPQTLSEPLSGENAQKMQQMMETVVNEGTGSNARIDGATVGGKTGTAQHGIDNRDLPYAWFISYAKDPDSDKQIAVAVVVEDASANRDDISGGGVAAPIAKSVMEAGLGR